jgi:hypothetical protein
METSLQLKHLQIRWVQLLVHHALQLMLVGIHIHIKWVRQVRLSALRST